MSTNYYMILGQEQKCPCCGQVTKPEQSLHIGKSSVGWVFALHVIPKKGLNSLEDWLPMFDKHPIVDEYGRPVSAEEMLNVITSRGNWLRRNPIDGRHCIGHGPGTWDLIAGEFS